jgi:hypothetical protein
LEPLYQVVATVAAETTSIIDGKAPVEWAGRCGYLVTIGQEYCGDLLVAYTCPFTVMIARVEPDGSVWTGSLRTCIHPRYGLPYEEPTVPEVVLDAVRAHLAERAPLAMRRADLSVKRSLLYSLSGG